ncbi:MAG: GNAT family N-acetyltransferase [Pseudomonadales bacterium]|nr:GNAT family N-acetyltransferase [Pseudomonadales bacterium]
MIVYVDRQNRHAYSQEMLQYHRLRKKVFCDTLGWVPASEDGTERDAFDDLYHVVILHLDDATGEVGGGVRLMPTLGPTLMHTVWSDLLPEPERYRSPNIWEATRFCVDETSNSSRKRSFVNRATLALSLAVLEFCDSNGIDQVIGVCERKIFDMQRVYGTDAEILSTKVDENGTEISCGVWDTGPQARAGLAWAKAFMGEASPAQLPKVA